jgi:subtilase family serine protease
MNKQKVATYKDLVVTSVIAPTTGYKGQNIVIPNTVKNQGTGSAGAFSVKFYLKTSKTSSAIYMGSRSVISMAAGASNKAYTKLTIPSKLAAGNYFILAYADPTKTIAESNEQNNYRYSATRTNIPNTLPDLTFKKEDPETWVLQNNAGNLGFNLKNQGKAPSAPCIIKFHMRRYDELSGWIYAEYAYINIPSVAPGATYIYNKPYDITHKLGWYPGYAKIDYNNKVLESNENNNELTQLPNFI